jgi:hypothetical protein
MYIGRLISGEGISMLRMGHQSTKLALPCMGAAGTQTAPAGTNLRAYSAEKHLGQLTSGSLSAEAS